MGAEEAVAVLSILGLVIVIAVTWIAVNSRDRKMAQSREKWWKERQRVKSLEEAALAKQVKAGDPYAIIWSRIKDKPVQYGVGSVRDYCLTIRGAHRDGLLTREQVLEMVLGERRGDL